MKKANKKGNISCLKCFDTGYITYIEDGVSYSKPCECLKAKIRKYHNNSMNIPKSLLDKDFSNFIINNKSQEKAVSYLKNYIEKYPGLDYGLLLMGPSGVGKTHLAVSLLKAIGQKSEEAMLFVDASSLLNSIKQNINDRFSDEASTPDIIRDVSRVPVLLLDDLGSQKVSMWTQDIIKIIINFRYNNNLITFITTPYEDKPGSLEKERFEQRIGEINRSRLYEMCKTIIIEGEDFRKMMINPRLI